METSRSPRQLSHLTDLTRGGSPSIEDKTPGFTKIRSGRTPETQGGGNIHSPKSPHRENGRNLAPHSPSTKGSKKKTNQDIGERDKQKSRGWSRGKKRKVEEYEEGLDEKTIKKRRQLTSLEKQLKINTVPGQSADFLELTEQHIKRASRRCLEGDSLGDYINPSVSHSPKLLQESATVNGGLINNIPSQSSFNKTDLEIDELVSRKLKEAGCDTSPFKSGKMSAFEISLLKGKQSVERRRSLEAATLRSSPRNNPNLPAKNYSDKVKRSSTKRQNQLSVKTSSDTECSDGSLKNNSPGEIKVANMKKRKKRRHSEQSSALSPSSIENCFISKSKGTVLRRPSHGSPTNDLGHIGKTNSLGKSASFSYRLNGSPELKGLPSVLSLNSLSGIPKKVQGSSFSSLYRGYCANGLSGTPPALSNKPSSFDSTAADSTKSSLRPDSLSVTKATTQYHPQGTSLDSVVASVSESALLNSSSQSVDKIAYSMKITPGAPVAQNKTVRKKMSLADTVSMLHKTSRTKNNSDPLTSTKVSPCKSEDGSHVSRKSSRSSTPNISPIKSEILTPNLTPCTTPSKSPSLSPGRTSTSPRLGKKKPYLFSKHDEVCARWHDGLFYLGTILKISEKTEKCLLRYEDSSEYMSLFKDIHRVAKEEELICCICLGEHSEPPNEIVLCDNCCQGFHQKCHLPHISSSETVDPDDEWFCRNCVFMMTIKVQGAIKEGQAADALRKMKLALPYDINTLTWDTQHKSNAEQCYCYCGGPGVWYQKMLQCCRCKQWFHEACLQCTDHPLLYGDSFYIFVCSPCNQGDEYIKRLDIEWPDIVHIALFNLAMDNRKKYVHVEEELVPWIEENWPALQLPQYDSMTVEDKLVAVNESLDENRARFVCAEVRKKCEHWGLRIRVCPPRIHITLPIKDKVTDDVMKSLKIKGRRSKVFIPVECKSPVQQLQHSPLRLTSGQVCKHLDNFIYKEDGTTSPAQNPSQGSALAAVRKSKVKLPLLDRLIPPEVSLVGHNHPFLTELEQEEGKMELETREKIWNSFDISDNDSESVTDGPPVLEKVEPIHLNSDHTPPMPVIKEKKHSRKSVTGSGKRKQKKIDLEKEEKESRASRRSSRKLSVPTEPVKESVCVKRLQSVENNCFAGYIESLGHFFFVNGKRRSSDGSLQYLISWEK